MDRIEEYVEPDFSDEVNENKEEQKDELNEEKNQQKFDSNKS